MVGEHSRGELVCRRADNMYLIVSDELIYRKLQILWIDGKLGSGYFEQFKKKRMSKYSSLEESTKKSSKPRDKLIVIVV